MKKLMLLIAVFMLGSASVVLAQEPVKKEQPATEQTENKKEEAKEEVKEESKEEVKEENKAEKPATEENAVEAPTQSAE